MSKTADEGANTWCSLQPNEGFHGATLGREHHIPHCKGRQGGTRRDKEGQGGVRAKAAAGAKRPGLVLLTIAMNEVAKDIEQRQENDGAVQGNANAKEEAGCEVHDSSVQGFLEVMKRHKLPQTP